jgi:hypothetical protein
MSVGYEYFTWSTKMWHMPDGTVSLWQVLVNYTKDPGGDPAYLHPFGSAHYSVNTGLTQDGHRSPSPRLPIITRICCGTMLAVHQASGCWISI